MDPTERATVEAALAGDQKAFETIIKTYSRILYSHAYSILRQSHEAEDVVQESFIKAYQSRWKIRSPEKFPQWLISITRNRALDRLRRRKTVPFDNEEHEMADETVHAPDRQLQSVEFHEKIHGVLAELPDHHRLAITLRYLDGMDYHTIEKTMGLSNGALRGILGRALQSLRITLKPLISPPYS